VTALQECEPFERATAFFLFGALQQFFFDGNKRTSRFMMNGVLMSHGIDAISVPAAKAQEFNEKMVRFYLSKRRHGDGGIPRRVPPGCRGNSSAARGRRSGRISLPSGRVMSHAREHSESALLQGYGHPRERTRLPR
jgi:hypothetical protein